MSKLSEKNLDRLSKAVAVVVLTIFTSIMAYIISAITLMFLNIIKAPIAHIVATATGVVFFLYEFLFVVINPEARSRKKGE
jgi:FtsH-binding integral membrane protein